MWQWMYFRSTYCLKSIHFRYQSVRYGETCSSQCSSHAGLSGTGSHRPVSTHRGVTPQYSENCTPELQNNIRMIRELILDSCIRHITSAITVIITVKNGWRIWMKNGVIKRKRLCFKRAYLCHWQIFSKIIKVNVSKSNFESFHGGCC